MARSVKILSLYACNIHFLLHTQCLPGQRQKDGEIAKLLLTIRLVMFRHLIIVLFKVLPIMVLPVCDTFDYLRCGVVVEPRHKARVACVRSFALTLPSPPPSPNFSGTMTKTLQCIDMTIIVTMTMT